MSCKKILPTLVSFVLLFLVFSCAGQKLTSKKVSKDGREMLYGQISRQQLYFDYPAWDSLQQAYKPDPAVVKKLKGIKGKYTVKIFLATWCPDSRREVPHFFKILQAANLTKRVNVAMWAVDRKLKLDNDLPLKFHIERVPTFIFFNGQKEIGRIIESPEALLLEEDIWTILNGAAE